MSKPDWPTMVSEAEFPELAPKFVRHYSRFVLGVSRFLGGVFSIFDNANNAKVTATLTHGVSFSFQNPLRTGRPEGVIAIACDTQPNPAILWSQSGSSISVTPSYPSGSGTASVTLLVIGG